MLLLAGAASAGGFETLERPDGWECFEQPWGWTDESPYMWYWVYVPENFEPGMPLVVYLHSSLAMNRKALTDPLPRMIIDGEIENVQAVVLVPQLPGDTDKDWLSAFDAVNDIVAKVMDEYQVDPDRVALAGFSLGAITAFEFVESTPDRYARMLSICGKVNYVRVQVDSFRNTELKVFTAAHDQTVNSASALSFVQWMNDAGYPAASEVVELSHEEVANDVFARKEIQEWLWLIPESEGEVQE